MFAQKCGADRACCILDNGDTMAIGDIHNRTHICTQSELMNRNNGFRAGSYQLFNFGRVDIESIQIDVCKYALSTNELHDIRSRNVRKGRDNDFITLPDSQRNECQMKAGGAITYQTCFWLASNPQ
jgi:hypothetical protein